MKSEERHRLQENELERWSQQAGKWFEKHGMMLVAGVCGVVVVAAIAFYVVRSMEASAARGWTELRNALAADRAAEYPTELEKVAKNYPNSAVGAWARLHAAELRLQRFAFRQFDDRSQSNIELSNDDPKEPGVEQQFRSVLQHPDAPEDVRERALYGLASTLEILSGGDESEALATYKQLVDEFPEGIYKPVAERRIEQLERKGTSEFYAWFRKQNPKPDDIQRGPTDGGISTLPDIPEELQLREDVTIETGSETGGPALVAPGENGGTEKPESSEGDATDSSKPESETDDSKSTESSTEGEKAAEGEKPADS